MKGVINICDTNYWIII